MSEGTAAREDRRDDRRIVRRHGGLVRRVFLVSGLTLLSRLLGFVREMVMAGVFGDASAVSDAFFTAWRVPNLFRRLFGEGALATSLQTAVTEADGRHGDEAGRRLFLRTIALAAGLLAGVWAVSSLCVAAMPDRMPLTDWPWLGADPAPVRDLALRVMPYVVLVCLAALCSGALQVRGHFLVPSLAPVVMNLGWIAALVGIGLAFEWGSGAEGEGLFALQWSMARWLAWGVLAAGAVQLFMQLPALQRFGLLRGRAGDGADSEPQNVARAADVLRASIPLAVGAAVYQVNVMIDGLMAEGMLSDGGPTALYYANRIQQFPLALVATAAISSVFPALKAHAHLRELPELRRLHDRSQLGVLFLALPSAVGLIVLAQPIAEVLFEHGNYGSEGAARIASALRMLGLALVPAGAVGLLGRTYIALDDPRTPVRVSIAMVGLNMLLNVSLVAGLGMDVAGLALATAVSSWCNLTVLAWGLRRRLGLPAAQERWGPRVLRFGLASAACGLGAGLGWHGLLRWVGAWHEALRLGLAIGLGVGAFLGAAQLLALPEWDALRRRLARRGSES